MHVDDVTMSPDLQINARRITANQYVSKMQDISLKHQALFSRPPHLYADLGSNCNTPGTYC